MADNSSIIPEMTSLEQQTQGMGSSVPTYQQSNSPVSVTDNSAADMVFSISPEDDMGDSQDLHFDYYGYSNMTYEEWLNESCMGWEVIRNEENNDYVKSLVEPLVSCSGILGILLTMVVLSRKTMCTSTNCYLTALAVADLVFLVILTIRHAVEKMGGCRFRISDASIVFNVYSIIVMDTFQYLTVGITVMLAVERYIAICHPMRAMLICTIKRARIIIVLLTIIAFILRVPKFFDLKISFPVLQNISRQMVATYRYDAYNEEVYTYIVTAFILTILPLGMLLVLNIRLIVEIKRSTRYLQYHLGTDLRVRSLVSKEELQITVMLISVIIVFFVCHVPYMIYCLLIAIRNFHVYRNSGDGTYALTEINFSTFKYVGQILLAIKSSINFILYCWFSEKFWATFMRIFCLRRCVPMKQSSHRPPNGYNSHNHQHSSQNNLHRPSCYITKETTC